MGRLVTKFKYLKPNQRSNAGRYADYIATRDGVEKIDDSQKYAPTTCNQKKMIAKILKDFPDSKDLLEYEDYIAKPTVENASEFITRAVENHADDLLHAKTYADYIATRPRAQHFGAHGLFTDAGVQVQLSKVSEELNMYQGNLWTVIISLRREDAQRLGYNCGERWRDMLRGQVQEFSDQFHIPLCNLKWFAAFHDEGHHPHVHLMVYSSDPKEGYLSQTGVAKLRSSVAKEIFQQDLLSAYEKQTDIRDTLRLQGKRKIKEFVKNMEGGMKVNPELAQMIQKLADRLSHTSGKKVYGFLKPELRNLVDAITDELAKEPVISQLYEKWYAEKDEIVGIYTEAKPKRVPLSQNNEFKSVRNAIVQEVSRMSVGQKEPIHIPEHILDALANEDIHDESHWEPDAEIPKRVFQKSQWQKNTWWTETYKDARKILYGSKKTIGDTVQAFGLLYAEAKNGNGFAMHDLALMLMKGLGCEPDPAQSQQWFQKTLLAFKEQEKLEPKKDYLQYRIGKLYERGYGTAKDDKEAAQWYEKAAANNQPYAAFALGNLYEHGHGVTQDERKAFEFYHTAAKSGNGYAAFQLGRMFSCGIGTAMDTEKANMWYQEAYKNFLHMEKYRADSKLWYLLGKVNLLGLGKEKDLKKARIYFEKAAALNNAAAFYGLARVYLDRSYDQFNLQTAMGCLKQAAEMGFKPAKNLKSSIEKNWKWSAFSCGARLLLQIGQIIQNNLRDDSKGNGIHVDRKLRQKINQKKQAQGLKLG